MHFWVRFKTISHTLNRSLPTPERVSGRDCNQRFEVNFAIIVDRYGVNASSHRQEMAAERFPAFRFKLRCGNGADFFPHANRPLCCVAGDRRMGQGLTAKCKPECSENNTPCCTQFGRGSWPSRDAFYENYDMGSILKNFHKFFQSAQASRNVFRVRVLSRSRRQQSSKIRRRINIKIIYK